MSTTELRTAPEAVPPKEEAAPLAAPAASAKDEEDEEEGHSLMTGVKAELIDWRKIGRPAECAFLVLAVVFLLYALSSGEWLCGATNAGKMVMVSVSTALEQGGAPYKLSALCASASEELSKTKAGKKSASDLPLPSHHAVACELAEAGSGAMLYGGVAVLLAAFLGLFFLLSALASRGVLGDVRSKLPAALPAEKIGSLVPFALWSLVVLLTYVALLAFALNSPSSLGGGPARLGYSYGLARLALLSGLCGLATDLTLSQGIGEDIVVAMLDSLLGHWSHLTRRQKATQVLLALGLLCELLLWVRRVEWGGLLLCYGLWAFSHHYGDHLCVFCAISVVSMSTDALTLANDEMHSSALAVPIITWVLLLTKLGAVASMIYFKDAYV